jgi:alanyl aminopeptidase
MVDSVLATAAAFGDRAVFDALVAALAHEKDHKARGAIFHALGRFRDPALAGAAMELLLTGDYDTREAFFPLLFGPLANRETRTLPFEFVKQNLDRLVAKLPREVGGDYAAALPALGEGFCSAAGRTEVDRFFRDRVGQYTGGPRRLAQTLESIDLCAARAAALGPSIAEFLGR